MMFMALITSACGQHKPAPANDAAPTTIRVTGIPDELPTEIARAYDPLVELLEARLGVPVQYVPVTDYGAAVQALVAGKVDFAWLGGFTHVQARNMAQVVPLVMRDIDREFHSVFIANTDSGVTDVAGLAGKRFAFGSKSSTSGHLMPRHFLLSEFQINPDEDFAGAPVYSGAHDATVVMVESGKVDAGVLNIQVWDRIVAEAKVDTSKVIVIWKTPPYVDYTWTARAALPEATRAAFAQTFLDLDATNPEHQVILERLGASEYVPASPSDFDAIERIARSTGMLEDP
jgi:phosphonate transport system substrate-binding protein